MPAFAHLAVAWVLVVIGLAAMARALARGSGRPAAPRTSAVVTSVPRRRSSGPTSRRSFGIAAWAERPRGRRLASTPLVYALSLGVYATAWSYYGSVGFAARSGLLFLTVYLGPTLCAIGWWWGVRRLIRIKAAYG